MADVKNNKTGALGADGLDDDTGLPVPKPSATPTPGVTSIVPPAGTGGLTQEDVMAQQIAAAINAAGAGLGQQNQTQEKFDFQVDTGVGRGHDYIGTMPGNQTLGLNAASSAGYIGLTDPTLLQLVQQAAGGDIRKYDNVYKTALGLAAYYQKSGKKITIADLLRKWTKDGLPKDVADPGGSGSGGPFSSTQRSIVLTSQSAAHSLVNQALTGYLGRQATPEESQKFLQALNAQEKLNPTTTVTKGYNDGSGNQTSSSTTTGGYDQADFAQRFAKSQEGYAEYQTATTYLDAFIGALENKARVI